MESRNQFLSQNSWWRVHAVTSMSSCFVEDYFAQSMADVIKMVSDRELIAVYVRKVYDDEEATEKEWKLAQEIQRIYQSYQKSQTQQAQEGCAMGYGEGWGDLLLDGEIP